MTREQLKALVKECLIEIMNDVHLTYVPSPSKSFTEKPIRGFVESTNIPRKKQFDSRLDTPIVSPQQKKNQQLSSVVKTIANGNPVMESIFADTVKTTLQEHLSADSVGLEKGKQQLVEHVGNLDNIFGEETTSAWANLAFSEPKRK